MAFSCTVHSTEGTQVYSDVRSITCLTPSGEIEILPGHAEAFFFLSAGPLRVEASQETGLSVLLSNAVCHVTGDTVDIIVGLQPL